MALRTPKVVGTTNRFIQWSSVTEALNELSKKRQQASQITEIDILQSCSYDLFFSSYLVPNKPVIIKNNSEDFRGPQEQWVDWTSGKPNFDVLAKLYGNSLVTVAFCDQRDYTEQKRTTMLFSSFLDYWKAEDRTDLLYLKDWHLVKEFPHQHIYTTPLIFSDDWIDDYWSKRDDDYRFVYMGPKGSWTPLHADVFRSFSWSTNIYGKKLWYIFPPWKVPQLFDSSGKITYDIRGTPLEAEAITCIQNAGETIFVPSGWYHQVHNLEDTISINHNWANGSSIDLVWEFFKQELRDVESAISHLQNECSSPQEWTDQCQLIMGANTGMNLKAFFTLLQDQVDLQFSHLEVAFDVSDIYTNPTKLVFDDPRFSLCCLPIYNLVCLLRIFNDIESNGEYRGILEGHIDAMYIKTFLQKLPFVPLEWLTLS